MHLAELLGRSTGPFQGLCLLSTAQTKTMWTRIHPTAHNPSIREVEGSLLLLFLILFTLSKYIYCDDAALHYRAFWRNKTANCVHFRQRNFCIETLYVNYLLHIPAFRPSCMHIHCWLHFSHLILAWVYSVYILCCRFEILGCNTIILYEYVLVKMLNIKIV
jgi:hypothetical protein